MYNYQIAMVIKLSAISRVPLLSRASPGALAASLAVPCSVPGIVTPLDLRAIVRLALVRVRGLIAWVLGEPPESPCTTTLGEPPE